MCHRMQSPLKTRVLFGHRKILSPNKIPNHPGRRKILSPNKIPDHPRFPRGAPVPVGSASGASVPVGSARRGASVDSTPVFCFDARVAPGASPVADLAEVL